MKVLQTQGSPSVLANLTKADELPVSAKPSPPDDSERPPSSPATTFPVFIKSPMIPLSPMSPSFPVFQSSSDESARHPARVVNTVPPTVSLQRAGPLTHRLYRVLTSTSDCSRRLPRRLQRKLLRIHHSLQTVALKTGSMKSFLKPSTVTTPSRRRRLWAMLLLALAQSRKRSPPM